MAEFAVVEVVIVGVHAVGALQGFFFLILLEWSQAFFAPRRLGRILRSTMFTDQVLAHGIEMLECRGRFVFLEGETRL